ISSTIIVPCESVEAYRSAPNLDIYDYSTCIGLEDIVKENIDFIVYPNPAKDNITITTKQLEGGILSLYDIMGKEILRRRINNDETILDINSLKAGIYILKVLDKENSIVGNKKIIKQ
ncbi:MAG: T9SS type A sorting domain-containing protein, partial [Bacteroidales bacterium]|nr:T9SS type A sorting domain-containing protein [Bacteroidales bacterium]